MKSFKQQVLADSPKHASIPFWSWNDLLQEEELLRQIRHMKSLGMRGFFMHARGGLETEYLSQDWFRAVKACIGEAERLGMEAWAYDENGWPSGFAGGELLRDPENQACELICSESDSYPAESPELVGVYRIEEGKITRLFADDGRGGYTVLYLKRDFSYVDVMDERVTRKFLHLTHQRYEEELGKECFGKTMPGFFTDEPQYFRYGTPWSPVIEREFPARFGYDILDRLPMLFFDLPGHEELRYDYHLLCHELFYNAFMKPVFDWCEEHGVKLTGHGIEEWGLGGQMMCCGGVMPFYLYQHLPGIDYLGRGVKNLSGAKQLGSVCAQSDKRVALSEMFACCGWDVSPNELKRIAELQFAGGVNLICEHLYAYSERGQRKRDFPNHYSEHNPWSKYFGEFETYFQHLGAALSQGGEYAPTLVLHPIRSAYLHYKHTVHNVGIAPIGNDSSGIAANERAYEALIRRLSMWQIPYHFGDETVNAMLGATLEGDHIRIGNCRYRQVILSGCETLTRATAELLREFLAAGGRLLIDGAAPTRMDGRRSDLSFLQSNLTWEELRESCGIRLTSHSGEELPIELQLRSTDHGRLVFLTNVGERDLGAVDITLPDCRGLVRVDIATLEETPVKGRIAPDGSLTVTCEFCEFASCLLRETDANEGTLYAERPTRYRKLPEHFTLKDLPENLLMLERACLSFDGGRTFTEPRPIARIRDELLRENYRGRLCMRFEFASSCLPEHLKLVCEPIRGMEISVNGRRVQPMPGEWRIDRRFLVCDIAELARVGKNEILLDLDYFQRDEVFRVLYGGGNEALRNCLCFDTELEAVYLCGSFAVRSVSGLKAVVPGILQGEDDFVLEEQTPDIDASDINRSGYPFFAGEMTLTAKTEYHAGEPAVYRLGGRFAVGSLTVNGEELGTRLFSDVFDAAEQLREGENTLELRLCFSNRNLLGPHHTQEFEPMFVTPRTFSFERAWRGGECAAYRRELSFVRFGIGFDRGETHGAEK